MQEIHSLAELRECRAMAKPKNAVADRARKLFGEGIKFVLKERGMSEADLGREVKKSRGQKNPQKTINNAVQGRTSIGLDNMAEMAEVLGVPLWLFLVDGLPKGMLCAPSSARLAKLVAHYAECDETEKIHLENSAAAYVDLARKRRGK